MTIETNTIQYYFSYDWHKWSGKWAFEMLNVESQGHDGCEPYLFDGDATDTADAHRELLAEIKTWFLAYD